MAALCSIARKENATSGSSTEPKHHYHLGYDDAQEHTERINGGVLYKKLKEDGILVRHFDAPRIENWLRITIGTPEQMQALMDAVDKILEV